MAKKNSTKTATEKSIQASEPRVQVFTGWQGINIKDAPLGWYPVETGYHDHRQTDLKPNYLMLQNNLVTEDTLTIQTRPASILIAEPPASNMKFTGVVHVHDRWLFCVVREQAPSGAAYKFKEFIVYHSLPYWGDKIEADDWNTIILSDSEVGDNPTDYQITEIGVFEKKFIAMTQHKEDDDDNKKYVGEIFTNEFIESWSTSTSYSKGIERHPKSVAIGRGTEAGKLYSPVKIKNPTTAPTITGHGVNIADTGQNDSVERIDVVYIYLNEYGMTLGSPGTSKFINVPIVEFSSEHYISISGNLPTVGDGWTEDMINAITGVDVYLSSNEEQNKAFAGHTDISGDNRPGKLWSVNYLGSMMDAGDWDLRDHDVPLENSTKGVPASHFAVHDSKLYFWGNPNKMYRLYIGGAPGAELSIARGYGGAWIDIEPGTGIEIMGTAKWKTSSGANIITIMCGNPNTNMVKRFNLIETNLVLSNENSTKGYMYEEVSNVIGCNSRWGYGVYDDGLYSISRYGLMLTTMAMEYNNQMRNQNVSDVIQPVFTDRLGNRLKDCRMVCIDSIIYISLHQPSGDDLDQVMLVYDIEKKSWYTFTHDEIIGSGQGETISHLFSIDSDERPEGLGVVTDGAIYLYPTAGHEEPEEAPLFNVLMETGELAVRQPLQQFFYLHQLEFRFDYFIGNADVYVEGTDYYGRPFKIHKILNKYNVSGNLREYTEYIHVGMLIQSYRIRMVGHLRCRLVSINAKLYTHANRIGTPYGYDDHSTYPNRYGGTNEEHHYIRNYNNLIDAIVT